MRRRRECHPIESTKIDRDSRGCHVGLHVTDSRAAEGYEHALDADDLHGGQSLRDHDDAISFLGSQRAFLNVGIGEEPAALLAMTRRGLADDPTGSQMPGESVAPRIP